MPTPSIGRIVIYNTTQSERIKWLMNKQQPAIIVKVSNVAGVNLQVFTNGDGVIFLSHVEEGKEVGEWQWPEITR